MTARKQSKFALSMLRKHRAILLGTFAAIAVASVIGWFYLDSRYPSWLEEVRLSDGRVITIHQRHEVFDNYGTNQSWVEIDLPELGGKQVWHSYLIPQRVDVFLGQIYAFGMPRGDRQYHHYMDPKNYLVGFVWNGAEFARIPFLDIPEALRQEENVYSCIPDSRTAKLTLKQKDLKWCPAKGRDRQFTKRINLEAYQSLAKGYSRQSGVAPATD